MKSDGVGVLELHRNRTATDRATQREISWELNYYLAIEKIYRPRIEADICSCTATHAFVAGGSS